MRRLVICADDFAMSRGISRTIVKLAQDGKLNAVSCMATSPRWPEDAVSLLDLPPGVEVGLHVVLSGDKPLTSMPRLAADGRLPSCDRLSAKAFLGSVPAEEVRAEVRAQFDRFEQFAGKPPDFVDGHQHTHVLPGIRTIVLEETARRAPGAWIRSCEDRLGRICRRPFPLKGLINAAQSSGMSAAAARVGLNCNDSFAGLYDFRRPYRDLFPSFLKHGGDFHLVLCHPGAGGAAEDPIRDARAREAETLAATPVAELAAAEGLAFQ